MAKIGYVRVSTAEQNTARQELIMEQLGVEKVFIDKLSGKDMNRPALKAMLEYVREGDCLVVESFSRLGRNTRDLLVIVDELTKKGVEFESQKEKMDTTTPSGKCMLTVMAAFSEMEREYIKQRQAEGIAIAKAEGRYKGRPKIEYDRAAFEREYRKWKEGKQTAVDTFKKLGMSKTRFYYVVKEYESKDAK